MVEIEAIIAAVTTSIITILGTIFGFIKWYLPWRSNRNKKDFKNGIKYLQSINNVLDTLIHDHGVKTAALFAGHNGGGLPRVDHEFFTSVLMWGGGFSFKEFSAWSEVRANNESIKYLSELLNKIEVILDIDSMPYSFTKSFFRTMGCKFIYLRYIDIVDNHLIYFLSGSETTLTDEQLNTLRVKSQEIDTIFKQNLDSIYNIWK